MMDHALETTSTRALPHELAMNSDYDLATAQSSDMVEDQLLIIYLANIDDND